MGLNRTGIVGAAACLAAVLSWVDVGARQAPQAPTGTAFLAGQVVDSSGKPVGGATVFLAGTAVNGRGSTKNLQTDSQGRFYFASLPAGDFGIIPAKDGYTLQRAAIGGRTLKLADGERITDLKAMLVKFGAIAGSVRDDVGDPVVGMTVLAMRKVIANGREHFEQPSRAKTDDRGVYRIAPLEPGDYVVCACAPESMPLDGTLLTTLASEPLQLLGAAGRALNAGASAVAIDNSFRTFAPTLYPNSATLLRAERVVVKPAEEKAAVDFALTPTRAVRVSGVVTGSASPITANAIQLVPAGEATDTVLTQIPPMLVQPDGRFDFINVPSGAYDIRVQTTVTGARGGQPSGTAMMFLGSRAGAPPQSAPPAATDTVMYSSTRIVVGDADVQGIQVPLRPGSSVTGRVVMEDGSALSATLQRSVVLLARIDRPQMVNIVARLNPDGTFRIPFAAPGRYRLSMTTVPPVRSMQISGTDMTDLPIDIAGDLAGIVLTLSSAAPASITGKVPDTAVEDNLAALIFPADRKLWADPSAASVRYRAAAVSRTGAFSALSISPGEYFVAVVRNVEYPDWQQASVLEALSRSAVRITLQDGEQKTIEVKK